MATTGEKMDEKARTWPGAHASVAPPLPAAPKHSAAPVPSGRGVGCKVALVMGVLASLAAVAYLVGVFVFSRLVFLPGTRINGDDVSLTPVSTVAAAHTSQAAGYMLNVSGMGIRLQFAASDISLRTDGNAHVASALSHINAWAWPAEVFATRNVQVEDITTFDAAKVSDAVSTAVASANEGSTPPTPAHVFYDEQAKTYAVAEAVAGTELDSDAVGEAITSALSTLEPRLVLSDDVLALGDEVDSERLEAAARQANTYLGAIQVLSMGGSDVFEVNADQVASWVRIGDDLAVTLDGDAVVEWARGPLSAELDSVGSTRSYTRPDGKACTVEGGSYGWSIDGAALAGQLVSNISSGAAATVEVPLLQSAVAFSPGGNDWGARYVDIDLSEQYVRFYGDDGALAWESACVTGDVAQGHNTPTGVYAINGNMKTGNVELRGEIDPETNEPEYISYVTYWMPFIGNMVALHDASWRGSFGGSIYRTNGSHGCVNLPTGAAASLYGMLHVGDVVVVHW